MKRKITAAFIFFAFFILNACADKVEYAVVVSANMEWKAVRKVFPDETYSKSVWGEFFFRNIKNHNVLFFHEGWGKVAAAGATQYVIDRFNPRVLINLGTCGGFEGKTERFDVFLVKRTVIYDIKEAMGDSREAISDYSTDIDLSWLGSSYPEKVKPALLVSGDRDLVPEDIPFLGKEYGAIAGDWESGAIAYVAGKNNVRLVILRGVSDVVSVKKGEAYGNFDLFTERAEQVMRNLMDQLPDWIEYIHRCLRH